MGHELWIDDKMDCPCALAPIVFSFLYFFASVPFLLLNVSPVSRQDMSWVNIRAIRLQLCVLF